MGRFPPSMGHCSERLNVPFPLEKNPQENSPSRRGPWRGFLCFSRLDEGHNKAMRKSRKSDDTGISQGEWKELIQHALSLPKPCYEQNPILDLPLTKNGLAVRTAQRLYNVAGQGQLGKSWRPLRAPILHPVSGRRLDVSFIRTRNLRSHLSQRIAFQSTGVPPTHNSPWPF